MSELCRKGEVEGDKGTLGMNALFDSSSYLSLVKKSVAVKVENNAGG